MRIIVLALALLPAAAVAQKQTPPAPPAKACDTFRMEYAKDLPQPARVKRLDQEPLANQYYPVLRTQDGCDVPVKIREEVGRTQR